MLSKQLANFLCIMPDKPTKSSGSIKTIMPPAAILLNVPSNKKIPFFHKQSYHTAPPIPKANIFAFTIWRVSKRKNSY
jgi:hypothetical protein